MTIEALIKVVPPPAEPLEAFVAPWEAVEADLGTPLPHDYKEFVRRYGNGLFMELLWICIPRSAHANRLEFAPIASRIFKEDFPDFPYAIWPDPGGLFPIGMTENHDCIFWRMAGPTKDWTIIVWGRASKACEAFPCGLTEFLTGLARGTIRPRDFPSDLTACEHLFQPVTP
jgi:hypothetical protein